MSLVAEFDFDLPESLIAQEPRAAGRRACWSSIARGVVPSTRSVISRRCSCPAMCRRQRHARVSGAPARPPRPERRGGRVPAARAGERRRVARARASRSEAQTRRAAGLRGRGARPRRALLAEVRERQFFGRRLVRFDAKGRGSSTPRSIGSGTCRCRPTSSARPARRSRAVPDDLRPRARIGRCADGGPALRRPARRGARPRGDRRARRSRCTSATARSSPCASTASKIIRSIPSATRFAAAAAAIAIAGARAGGRVVAVGTTTTRALESAAGDVAPCGPAPARRICSSIPGHRFASSTRC